MKRLLGLLLMIVIICCISCAAVAAHERCGENATWTMDKQGLLTISGSGKINYGGWDKKQIKRVMIRSGVTEIDFGTFSECEKMTSISLPDSLTAIGYHAFYDCCSLKKVTIPGKVLMIGEYLFENCTKLETVTLSDGVTSIKAHAFENCRSLKKIVIPQSVRSFTPVAFAKTPRELYLEVTSGSQAERIARSYGLPYDNGKRHVVGIQITNVNQKVKWIVDNYITSGMSEREKVLILHNWLIYNADYDGTRKIHDASGVLIKGFGVCESYAKAYELLLTEAGIANRYIRGSNGFNHGWNLVRIDGQWYHSDATADDPGGSGRASNEGVPVISGYESSKNFLMTDSQARQDYYQWDPGISADDNRVGSYHESKPAPAQRNKVTVQGGIYEIAGDYARLLAPENMAMKELIIPDKIEVGGKTYRVTQVSAKACKGMEKLQKLTIGKNVLYIGDKAFFGCKQLKKIKIRTSSLNENNVGEDAFKWMNKSATITCPKKMIEIYKLLLIEKGVPSKVKFN